jgi:hypothetical protein
MKRSLIGLLLLSLLGPGCKTGGARAPAAPPAPPPDLLRPYEGALRILLHKGDVRALTVKAGESPSGDCDVAVRVRSVVFDKGTARLALETLGLPRVGERRVSCKRLEPDPQLTLTGFPSGPVTPEVTARIDEVLPTPEAYLRAKGTAFDRPAGVAPTEVASKLPDASEGERRLARATVAWPQPLLSVEALSRAPKKLAHFERLVTVEAVVGTDGRLYHPVVKTSLGPADETAVSVALLLWRFEPARRADGPVGARVTVEAALRVY